MKKLWDWFVDGGVETVIGVAVVGAILAVGFFGIRAIVVTTENTTKEEKDAALSLIRDYCGEEEADRFEKYVFPDLHEDYQSLATATSIACSAAKE